MVHQLINNDEATLHRLGDENHRLGLGLLSCSHFWFSGLLRWFRINLPCLNAPSHDMACLVHVAERDFLFIEFMLSFILNVCVYPW